MLRETLNHQQLSLCQHPHIVEFHEVFLTPSYLAVVMEYVNGTNLQHYLEVCVGLRVVGGGDGMWVRAVVLQYTKRTWLQHYLKVQLTVCIRGCGSVVIGHTVCTDLEH